MARHLRPAPSYERLYCKALRAAGVPPKEAPDWYRVALKARPHGIKPSDVSEYSKAGFTPTEASGWIAAPVITPAPAHAYTLHQKGWTGLDYLLVRDRFPNAWANSVFMSGETDRGNGPDGDDLWNWLQCPLPGRVVAQYVLAGIPLPEALSAWESVRATDPAEWDKSIEFLHAFHDVP